MATGPVDTGAALLDWVVGVGWAAAASVGGTAVGGTSVGCACVGTSVGGWVGASVGNGIDVGGATAVGAITVTSTVAMIGVGGTCWTGCITPQAASIKAKETNNSFFMSHSFFFKRL